MKKKRILIHEEMADGIESAFKRKRAFPHLPNQKGGSHGAPRGPSLMKGPSVAQRIASDSARWAERFPSLLSAPDGLRALASKPPIQLPALPVVALLKRLTTSNRKPPNE